jgi:hypothetical protein
MDRVDHGTGGVPVRVRVRRARWLALAAVMAGLVLSATGRAALPANVAVIAGQPIARQQFNHWLVIVAKAQKGPLIVPTEPPRFDHCIAQARAKIPSLRHDSARALRKDCRLLFTALSQPVLDLLIRHDWQDEEAARDGIVITPKQVGDALAVDRHKQFPRPGEFRRFLRRSGQTFADIKFRVRGTLVFTALQKAEHLSAGGLEAELTRRFKTQTTCARYYVIEDCAGG